MATNIRFNWIFKLGSLSMFSLVALGAVYGHRGRLDELGTAYFTKAQTYHLVNNVGLISASLISPASVALRVAIGGFLGGLGIFVAPLYCMAVSGKNEFISKTMPIGGFAMLVSWLALIFA